MPAAIAAIDEARRVGRRRQRRHVPYTGAAPASRPWSRRGRGGREAVREPVDPAIRARAREEMLDQSRMRTGSRSRLADRRGVMPIGFLHPREPRVRGTPAERHRGRARTGLGGGRVRPCSSGAAAHRHVYFLMDESNLALQLRQPWIKDLDGRRRRRPGVGGPAGPMHPRGYGTSRASSALTSATRCVIGLEDARAQDDLGRRRPARSSGTAASARGLRRGRVVLTGNHRRRGRLSRRRTSSPWGCGTSG